MITLEKVKQLSELELEIYHFLSHHESQIKHMKLKDIAEELHVSTSMVTRCTQKLGYSGFSEFKTALKIQREKQDTLQQRDVDYLIDYFQKINNHSFKEEIRSAAHMMMTSDEVLFLGIGISSALAKVGSYLMNRRGFKTHCIEDFSYRLIDIYDEKTCAVVLTVSGETKELIRQMQSLRSMGVKMICITNRNNTTATKLADQNLCYYVPDDLSGHYYDSATQVPVIHILESLANEMNDMRIAQIE